MIVKYNYVFFYQFSSIIFIILHTKSLKHIKKVLVLFISIWKAISLEAQVTNLSQKRIISQICLNRIFHHQ